MEKMNEKIENGLKMLRREARNTRPADWPDHDEFMRRAQAHIEACGGRWLQYESALSREFAELLGL